MDIRKIIGKIEETKQLCGSAKIILIAKADCYGSGAICARLLSPYVDYYGVARAIEGARLRINGVYKPIIVLSHSKEQLIIEQDYKLIPAIGTADDLMFLDGYRIPEVHICIDTGMNRNGFKSDFNYHKLNDNNDKRSFKFANSLLESAVRSIKNVQISGVFSHIYHDSYVNAVRQACEFENASDYLSDLIGYMPLRHLWASGGIAFINKYGLQPYDAVRLGISAYEDANYVISNVLSVKKIKSGETVGYEAAFTAVKDMRIAIIEGGYADGIPRSIKDGYVLINGNKAKIIGYVCMDVFMADVTNIECKSGDTAVILDNNTITLNDLAIKTNTCKYEVLTRMQGRYKYVYLT